MPTILVLFLEKSEPQAIVNTASLCKINTFLKNKVPVSFCAFTFPLGSFSFWLSLVADLKMGEAIAQLESEDKNKVEVWLSSDARQE